MTRYVHLNRVTWGDVAPYCSRSRSELVTDSREEVTCPHCKAEWDDDMKLARAKWPRLYRDDLTVEEMECLVHECSDEW